MVIQRFTRVKVGLGWEETFITHIADYQGVIDMLNGAEILSNQNIQIESSHILIGPVEDIKAGDRVIFGGIIYDIKYVDNPMELNQHLEITLKRSGVVGV